MCGEVYISRWLCIGFVVFDEGGMFGVCVCRSESIFDAEDIVVGTRKMEHC